MRSYDLILLVAERLEERGQKDLVIRNQVAQALFNKGVRLGALNRSEAIVVYEEVMRRFGEATEPALRGPGGAGPVQQSRQAGRFEPQ